MTAPLLGDVGGNRWIEIKLGHIEDDLSFADCLLGAGPLRHHSGTIKTYMNIRKMIFSLFFCSHNSVSLKHLNIQSRTT